MYTLRFLQKSVLLASSQVELPSRARRYLLCILANMLEHTWQAMHVWTHIVLFANFSVAAFCKNLLGNIPNPLTIFSKSATLLRSWTSLYLGK